MERRRLGRTDLLVPTICLGTMTFGQQNTEAEGFEQMDYALDQGIDFFDTAELYSIPPRAETQGSTERIIGNWMKARGTRSKIILASKVAGRGPNTWMRTDGSTTKLIKAQIDEAVFGSLKRLQTDYLDLYQVHFPDRAVGGFGSNLTVWTPMERLEDEVSIEDSLEALDAHVKAGRIRHIGLSNETAWGTMRWLGGAEYKGHARVQSIQNAYNLLNRTYEINLAEVSEREDVSLLAYSPLGQGYLTGKYLNGARPAGARTTLFNRGTRYEKPYVDEAIAAYVALANEHGLDVSQMAIAFTISRPFLTSSIIGATKMDQLKTDIAARDVKITPELELAINAIHARHMNPAP